MADNLSLGVILRDKANRIKKAAWRRAQAAFLAFYQPLGHL